MENSPQAAMEQESLPFEGITLAMSGSLYQTRAELKEKLQQLGVTVHATVQPSTTCLVTTAHDIRKVTRSNKVVQAAKLLVPTVHDTYIREILATKKPVDLSSYLILVSTQKSNSAAQTKSTAQTKPAAQKQSAQTQATAQRNLLCERKISRRLFTRG